MNWAINYQQQSTMDDIPRAATRFTYISIFYERNINLDAHFIYMNLTYCMFEDLNISSVSCLRHLFKHEVMDKSIGTALEFKGWCQYLVNR